MIVDCPKCNLRHVILERAVGTTVRCSCGTAFQLPHDADTLPALKCANCGGNPPAGANHCPYCDAHLATLRCARCLANSIEGDEHCRACGHKLITPVRKLSVAPANVLDCPRCNEALVSVLIGEGAIDECTRCGGEWLDHELFDLIVKDRRDQESILATLKAMRPSQRARTPSVSNPEGPFYVPCPECRQVMDRRQFAAGSGVVIDVCASHGMWFDQDELSSIIRFVGEGGLEKAAERVHRRRMSELARQQYRAATQAAESKRAAHYHFGGSVLGAIIELLISN